LIDGGKWVCSKRQLLSHPKCVVYSLGSNGEPSFENRVLTEFPHCQMHTYDPTLNDEQKSMVFKTWGVTFHDQGLASEGGLSASPFNCTTLHRSMAENGVAWIDVLKMDIEGFEWDVFLEIFEKKLPMPFTQILVELHTSMIKDHLGSQLSVLRRFFRGMEDAGYRIFSLEPNFSNTAEVLEYSFIKVDRNGNIVRGNAAWLAQE